MRLSFKKKELFSARNGAVMPDHPSISRGPSSFEDLLQNAGLSEREADAVRTVAMGLTAAEAAPLMGVEASTVGSYRQRAYQKLGVSTKAEFLSMPSCAQWQKALVQEDAPPDEISKTSSETSRSSESSYLSLFLKCLLASVAIVSVIVVISLISRPQYAYVDSPNGSITSDFGDVPDVTGMRADSAASALASAGYFPEFLPRTSSEAPGTVLRVSKIGDMKDADENRSAIAWDGGSASGYNVHGDWKAYVLIDVAV